MYYKLYIGRVHPVAHVTMNEYNNPSFATMFQRALLNTCITTCFGLNPSHHQVLSYTEYCDTRPRNYLLSSLFYSSVYIFMLLLAIAVVYMHDITPSTLVVILKNY
jgi:hypothetical protein